MDARLLVSDTQGQTHEVLLAKDLVRLGGAASDQIRIGAGFPPSVLEFRHQPSLSSWVVVKLDPTAHVFLNGSHPVESIPVPLDTGSIVTANGVSIVFTQRPDPPQIQGAPATTIPLPKSGILVLGRISAETSPSPQRVDLDPTDFSISGEHVRITAEKNSFVIEDISRLGTSLNGDAFSKATAESGNGSVSPERPDALITSR